MVGTEDGRIVREIRLGRRNRSGWRLLPQAEGITFGVDGTLYLASEGHYGPAVLAAYAPVRP